MTATTLSLPFFHVRFARRIHRHPTSHDDTIARRNFINEMVAENPSAFASEHDVYQVMCHLPGKF